MSNATQFTQFLQIIEEVLQDLRENWDMITPYIPEGEELNFHHSTMNILPPNKFVSEDDVGIQRVVLSDQDLRYSICACPEKRLEMEARMLGL